jgi:hydroxymethylbilane synthase
MDRRLRIGTRGSALARAQAEHVKTLLLARQPAMEIEIKVLRVSGDENPTPGRAGEEQADKSRWVDTIEEALLDERIDLAVHSAKDVPGELAAGLSLLGAPSRAGVEDALCGTTALEALPAGARVGTSSIRRAAQLRAARADLEIVTLSGNVDTRLRKLATATRSSQGGVPTDEHVAAGELSLDAIVLARAGLQRLGREAEIGVVLDPERFVPAPGQGALALEGRVVDTRTREAVAEIVDGNAFACLRAERALARELSATCNTPLGAYAIPAGCGCLHMRAWVGLPDGSAWVSDELAETGTDHGSARHRARETLTDARIPGSASIPESISAEGAGPLASVGGFYDPEALGRRVAERMLTAGAGELLRRAEEMTGVGHA